MMSKVKKIVLIPFQTYEKDYEPLRRDLLLKQTKNNPIHSTNIETDKILDCGGSVLGDLSSKPQELLEISPELNSNGSNDSTDGDNLSADAEPTQTIAKPKRKRISKPKPKSKPKNPPTSAEVVSDTTDTVFDTQNTNDDTPTNAEQNTQQTINNPQVVGDNRINPTPPPQQTNNPQEVSGSNTDIITGVEEVRRSTRSRKRVKLDPKIWIE